MSKKPRKTRELPSITTKFSSISPKTDNQKAAFHLHGQDKHLILTGWPGTGKTLIAFNFAFELLKNCLIYKKVVVVRSVVPTRDMGFLPGSSKEKSAVYEDPYHSICETLFPDVESPYTCLKGEKVLEFFTTSFVRGITISDAIVIIDEAQNLNQHEIFSLLTRLGENCRVIICGDSEQTDLVKESSGLRRLVEAASKMEEFGHVDFTIEDIVRSMFVKNFIKAWTSCLSVKSNSTGRKTSPRQLLCETNSSSTPIPAEDFIPLPETILATGLSPQ